MKIIKAKQSDYESVAKIEYNSGYKWREDYKKEIKTAKRLLKSKSKVYFFIINKVKVSYIAFSVLAKSARIDFFAVLKSCQRKGIGTKLLKYAINSVKKSKIKRIRIAVWEKNKAVKLYKKIGFSIIGIKEDYYPNGDNRVIMELEL